MEAPRPSHVVVKVGGTAIPPTLARTLVEFDIECTYNRPDLCILTFTTLPNQNPPASFELAKEFTVSMKVGTTPPVVIFDGEVTCIEFEGHGKRRNFVVQGQDRLHRLFRGDFNRVFTKKTASNIVTSMAGEAGLTAQCGTTSVQHEHLQQHNETNGDFIARLASELNFHVAADGSKLVFDKIGSGGDSREKLAFGRDLLSFGARATAASFQEKSEVRGWDEVKKEAIIGTASGGDADIDDKVTAAASPFKAAQAGTLLIREGIKAHLDEIAKASVERSIDANLQAEGTCNGNPKLQVDKLVEVANVCARYNRKYRLSHVRHRWSADASFTTEFTCRGGSDQSLAGVMSFAAAAESPEAQKIYGVVNAIVTDNKDPDGLGRVKVALPWLDATHTTDWCRIAFPGAGGINGPHGWYLLPEINDEVLVAFHHGDPRRPIVLGGLYNGVDKPPIENGVAVAGNGMVNQHIFQTRSGAFLLFDDADGHEALEYKSKSGNFNLRFEEGTGLTLKSEEQGNKINITPEGAITIEYQKDISIESATGKLSLKAAGDVSIESTGGKVALKASTGDVSAEGMNVKLNGSMQAELKASAGATVDGGASATIKGAMVMIN
jgi:uncharacterized protein involved in type VI secretion and phage assembly